jgi:hypothetical protein
MGIKRIGKSNGLRGFIGWVVAMARGLFQDEQDVGEDSITTKKKSL